jgi:hypothetical protein
MTDLIRIPERRESHPPPEWATNICNQFGVSESGLPKYRVIWNPDRLRTVTLPDLDTGGVRQRIWRKYPAIGMRWILEVLLPFEIYGPWNEAAFGPKPADGEYCHTHTFQLDLEGMLKCPTQEKTIFMSLEDFGPDNLTLLLHCIEKGKAVQGWQLKRYDEELIAAEEAGAHDQFEAAYDNAEADIYELDKLCDKTGLRTSLDPLPNQIENARRRKAKQQGKQLIH